MKDYLGRLYSVPDEFKGRFEYVNYKINFAKENDHDELFMAYNVVLKSEFGKFRIKSPKRWFSLFKKRKNEYV